MHSKIFRSKYADSENPDLRTDPVTYDLDWSDHPWVAARKIVLECMDAAVQQKTKAYTEEERAAHTRIDIRQNYKAIAQMVRENHCLK